MTKNVNYLPFVQRSLTTGVATVKGVVKAEARISSFSLGFEERAILGDLTLRPSAGGPFGAAANAQFSIRLGWLSKGYLLDVPVPMGVFTNHRRGYASVWKFPRPYTLYPGEKLRALMTPVDGGTYEYPRGIMFNGVRTKDGIPYALTGTSDPVAATVNTPIIGPNLMCPDDSPIDIYSVSIDEFQTERVTAGAILQVYGPGGREWFKTENDVSRALPEANWVDDCWISPPISYITLGEKNGWVMDSNDTLLIEYIAQAGTGFSVSATLRGSLEVSR